MISFRLFLVLQQYLDLNRLLWCLQKLWVAWFSDAALCWLLISDFCVLCVCFLRLRTFRRSGFAAVIIWLSEMSACFVLHDCFPFSLPSLGQVIMRVRLVLVSWEQTRSSMLPENLCLFCDPHLLALYLSCNEH